MRGSAVLLPCNPSTLTTLKFPRVSDTDSVVMIHSFGLWHLNLGDSASCVYLPDRWIHMNGVVPWGYQLGCLSVSTLWLLSCLMPLLIATYSCGQLQMEQFFIWNCSRERIIRLFLDFKKYVFSFFFFICSRDFMRGHDLVCGIWIANPNRQPHSPWGLTGSALFLRTRMIWLILVMNGAVCEGFYIVLVVPMKGTNYCLLVCLSLLKAAWDYRDWI